MSSHKVCFPREIRIFLSGGMVKTAGKKISLSCKQQSPWLACTSVQANKVSSMCQKIC